MLNLYRKTIKAATAMLALSAASAFADGGDFAKHLGATLGAGYGVDSIKNSGMNLKSRTMGTTSIEGLAGYTLDSWLFGVDFDYQWVAQYTSLAKSGGTNLRGNAWILGLGTRKSFSDRFSLQGSIGFLGAHHFTQQTSTSKDDHISHPLSIRVKPQYFLFSELPLSLDLDLRFTNWSKFDVAGTKNSKATQDLFAGLGLTWHFGSRNAQSSSSEVAAATPAAKTAEAPAPVEAAPATSLEAQKTELAKDFEVETTDTGLLVKIKGDMSFGSGSAELSDSAKQSLARAGATMARTPNQKIRVEGHTDSSGKKTSNLALSQKRADAVKQVLVSSGLATESVEAKGIGPARPLVPNTTNEGRATNRRVEIYIENNGAAPKKISE